MCRVSYGGGGGGGWGLALESPPPPPELFWELNTYENEWYDIMIYSTLATVEFYE